MVAASTRSSKSSSAPAWHRRFVSMLPTIVRYSAFCFRRVPTEARAELIQEAVCNACCAYSRLVQRKREDAANATSLARYAVRQVRSGRRVGAPLNICDVSSAHCRVRNGVVVDDLWFRDEHTREWVEVIVQDRRSDPSEIAAMRVDLHEWMMTLSRRERRIVELLAIGERATRIAKKFGVSDARISQIRTDLHRAWLCFHGEMPAAVPA